MSRGVYSHEQDDSDFAWLIDNYKNSGKKCILIDVPGTPIVLITLPDTENSEIDQINSSKQSLEPSNQER
jgi:hypothetical protein